MDLDVKFFGPKVTGPMLQVPSSQFPMYDPLAVVSVPEENKSTGLQCLEVPSSPLDSNPLLNVRIPEKLLQQDTEDMDLPTSSSEESNPLIDHDHLEIPPSFSSVKASSPTPDRNPLRDIEIPNEIIAPDFEHVKPSPLPTTYSARPLSSLSCPPTLPSSEWNSFISELERAALASKRQKTIAVAVGISEPPGTPITNGVLTWGVWRYLAPKPSKAIPMKRESATAVVERWNERWAVKGVRLALEIKVKRDSRLKSRKSKAKVDQIKLEAAGMDGGSEVDEDLKDFQMIQEVM